MTESHAAHDPQQERPGTRDRILDVAERMFADYGFEQTALRSLTREAGVNLAAVHYHFGSKEQLFEAVLERLVGPVNTERLALLDAVEAQGSPSLERVIEAFVAPPLRLLVTDAHRGAVAPRLLGRCLASPDEQMGHLIRRLFGEIIDRFVAAFSRALPTLPQEEVLWRMWFMVGVMTHTLGCGHRLKLISQGVCDPTRSDEALQRVVEFVAAGMRAPAPDHRAFPEPRVQQESRR